MIIQTGSAATGAPFAQTEYADVSAFVTLAAGATLHQGQVCCRDLTALATPDVGTSNTSSVSDYVVAGSSANAGELYGAYQGEAVTNPDSDNAAVFGPFLFRRFGIGYVYAGVGSSGTAIKVGNPLIMAQPSGTDYAVEGTAALNKTVGMAIAQGSATAVGDTVIAVPGSGTTIETIIADIAIR